MFISLWAISAGPGLGMTPATSMGKAGQLIGLSAGMPGSAQYEKLVFVDADPKPKVMPERLLGIEALNVLNLGHLFIVALIILGNLAFFITRPKGVE